MHPDRLIILGSKVHLIESGWLKFSVFKDLGATLTWTGKWKEYVTSYKEYKVKHKKWDRRFLFNLHGPLIIVPCIGSWNKKNRKEDLHNQFSIKRIIPIKCTGTNWLFYEAKSQSNWIRIHNGWSFRCLKTWVQHWHHDMDRSSWS